MLMVKKRFRLQSWKLLKEEKDQFWHLESAGNFSNIFYLRKGGWCTQMREHLKLYTLDPVTMICDWEMVG